MLGPEHRDRLVAPRDRSAIISDMQRTPGGITGPLDTQQWSNLHSLTSELIQAHGGEGAIINRDPYKAVLARRISIVPEVPQLLQGKKVLVTGGEGCIGQRLISMLSGFNIASISSVDKAANDRLFQDGNVRYHTVDIRDRDSLLQVFEDEQPDIVFHLAAQQHVGPGEAEGLETVTSNVFGTENVIWASELTGVNILVNSSTAKVGQYFTPALMGGTKKIQELLLARAAQSGNVKYSMTRFAHVGDNSDLRASVRDGINEDLVRLHQPDRRIYAQSAQEAAGLVLNAATIAEPGTLRFATVVDEGELVNNVDVALHEIVEAKQKTGKIVPIYFAGIQEGYEPGYFHGQRDPGGAPPLRVNALEAALTRREIDRRSTGYLGYSASGEMYVAQTLPFDTEVLGDQMLALHELVDSGQPTPEDLKESIGVFGKQIALSQFARVDQGDLVSVLKAGLHSRNPGIFKETVALIASSFRGKIDDYLEPYEIGTLNNILL